MEKNCLNCKFYKVEDVVSGFCRKQSSEGEVGKKTYQMVRADDVCEKWIDAGQQYFIRLGWIESQKKKQQDGEKDK
ncbi:MAG: hypothetical protein J7L69_07345 [Desulfobulbaceae bacterium]|nr:hypothetical protein [Desulfobulbaceae bacterium]